MNIAIISFQDNSDMIGAKYVHAFLQSKGHGSLLILQPLQDKATDSPLIDFIGERGISLVGLSIMSGEFFRACQFAESLKKRFPDIPLAIGGIHATIAPDECLGAADIVVRGEGEHTMHELAQRLETGQRYDDLAGISIRAGGIHQHNPMRPLEADLGQFPFPKHCPDNFFVVGRQGMQAVDKKVFRSIARYSGTFPNIITTRGCPFCCTYCCNSALTAAYGKYPVRKRTVDSVLDELREIIREHEECTTLNIQDDCFLTYDDAWIQAFADRYSNEIRLPFVIRTTPLHISRANLEALKRAGLAMVMMGLQSGSNRTNKEVFKRGTTAKSFLKAAAIVKELGIAAYYDVILDNPFETEEDVLQSVEVLLKTPKPYQLVLFSLCFYQGTELHRRATAEGLPFVDPRADDYGRITPSALNKIISLTPNLPEPLVRYLLKRRDCITARVAINLCVAVNIALLRPVGFLLLMHRAYGSNLFMTLRLMRDFASTALAKMLKV